MLAGMVRLGRIELPRVSCSSLPFAKCRIFFRSFPDVTALISSLLGVLVLPQLQRRGLRGLFQDFKSPIRLLRYALFTRGVHVELVDAARIRTQHGADSMRRALFPSEVAASTPIGLSVPRFPAPHTLAAFSIRPRIRMFLFVVAF